MRGADFQEMGERMVMVQISMVCTLQDNTAKLCLLAHVSKLRPSNAVGVVPGRQERLAPALCHGHKISKHLESMAPFSMPTTNNSFLCGEFWRAATLFSKAPAVIFPALYP